MKARRTLRHLAQPVFILPVLLATALLIFAFKLGNLGKVIERVQAIPIWILAIALGFAVIYLALKALQLHLLLVNLGVRPAWRPFALAFAVGELTLTLPFGLFTQNWILSASGTIRIGRSAAATVVMLLAEIAVVLLLLAVVGIPHWPELRPIAILALIVFGAILSGFLFFERTAHYHVHKMKHQRLRQALLEGIELLKGLKRLSSLRLLAINLLLAAVYLGALVSAFFFVGRGMGLHSLDYLTATTIYTFSLAVVLLGGGLFTQIGTVEVLGMLAARAWGIAYTDGLALMLGFRLVWTGAMWLLNLPVLFALWRTIHPQSKGGPPAASSENG
ncbi:MAG: lysylphosphatidylglycerol synthase domain-containing protein [Gammaproteobacteria bacterium]